MLGLLRDQNTNKLKLQDLVNMYRQNMYKPRSGLWGCWVKVDRT